MPQESDGAVAEKARRRVVSGDDQLEDGRQQLLLGEALVALGRLDEAFAVAEVLRASGGGGRPWSRAMALRCEAQWDALDRSSP